MIPVIVVKVAQNEVYHLRIDKPFESYLSRLFIAIANPIKEVKDSKTVIVEFTMMQEEDYLSIPSTNNFASIPRFIQNLENKT